MVAACGVVAVLASCGDGGSAGAPVPVLDVELGRYTIEPETLTVPAGAVELRVTNVDTMVHSLVVAGRGTRQLAPGESETISVDTQPGDRRMWCDIAGHADLGQVGVLRTVAAGASTTT